MVDILFILALALLILGPKKLPQIARQLGGLLAQFKQMQGDFRRQLDTEVFKGQIDDSTGTAAATVAVSRPDDNLPLLEEPDLWVTHFRSAKLNPISLLTDGANITQSSVTAE